MDSCSPMTPRVRLIACLTLSGSLADSQSHISSFCAVLEINSALGTRQALFYNLVHDFLYCAPDVCTSYATEGCPQGWSYIYYIFKHMNVFILLKYLVKSPPLHQPCLCAIVLITQSTYSILIG